MELPKRKKTRLENYDYSQDGVYFITICTKDKLNLFGDVVGANCVRPKLSDIGQVVESAIIVLSNTYTRIVVDKFVVMPNHIHMTIVVACENGRTQFAPTISRIVKQFTGIIAPHSVRCPRTTMHTLERSTPKWEKFCGLIRMLLI